MVSIFCRITPEQSQSSLLSRRHSSGQSVHAAPLRRHTSAYPVYVCVCGCLWPLSQFALRNIFYFCTLSLSRSLCLFACLSSPFHPFFANWQLTKPPCVSQKPCHAQLISVGVSRLRASPKGQSIDDPIDYDSRELDWRWVGADSLCICIMKFLSLVTCHVDISDPCFPPPHAPCTLGSIDNQATAQAHPLCPSICVHPLFV